MASNAPCSNQPGNQSHIALVPCRAPWSRQTAREVTWERCKLVVVGRQHLQVKQLTNIWRQAGQPGQGGTKRYSEGRYRAVQQWAVQSSQVDRWTTQEPEELKSEP